MKQIILQTLIRSRIVFENQRIIVKKTLKIKGKKQMGSPEPDF